MQAFPSLKPIFIATFPEIDPSHMIRQWMKRGYIPATKIEGRLGPSVRNIAAASFKPGAMTLSNSKSERDPQAWKGRSDRCVPHA